MRSYFSGRKSVALLGGHLARLAIAAHRTFHRQETRSGYEELAQILWNVPDTLASSARTTCYSQWLARQRDATVEWDSETEQLFTEIAAIIPAGSLSSDTSSRLEVDWVLLGFQGHDPTTDFRAAGRLGVELFHAFVTRYSKAWLIFEESGAIVSYRTDKQLMQPWYPVALVSIRFTAHTMRMFESDPVYWWALGFPKQHQILDRLANLHIRLLVEFHEHWKEAVRTGRIKTYFDNEFILGEFERTFGQRFWDAGDKLVKAAKT